LAQVYHRTYLQAANRNLKLVIPEVDANLYVRGDEQRLLQSLVNLIDATISSVEGGSIIITVSHSSSENLLTINIDTPVAMNIWSESTQLKTPPPQDITKNSAPPQFSLGMRMMLSKTLLETMKGQLQIKELSPPPHPNSLTRLQCLLPFASPSAVTQ
jgi:phosphoglycerate-specific signal transduction histidine kinase